MFDTFRWEMREHLMGIVLFVLEYIALVFLVSTSV